MDDIRSSIRAMTKISAQNEMHLIYNIQSNLNHLFLSPLHNLLPTFTRLLRKEDTSKVCSPITKYSIHSLARTNRRATGKKSATAAAIKWDSSVCSPTHQMQHAIDTRTFLART